MNMCNSRWFFNLPIEAGFSSKNIFTPEEYTPEFVKEKVEAFAYYLFSCYSLENRNLSENGFDTIYIYLFDPLRYEENDSYNFIFEYNILLNQENLHHDYENNFFKYFDMLLKEKKEKFSCRIPLKPFKILLEIFFHKNNVSGHNIQNEQNDESVQSEQNEQSIRSVQNVQSDQSHQNDESDQSDESEESEEKNRNINTNHIFKTDECVICLTNPPSVLFCNCGHVCVCDECDTLGYLEVCPKCRVISTIKRTIA